MTQLRAQRIADAKLTELGWLCTESAKSMPQWFSLTCMRNGSVLPVYFRTPLEGKFVIAHGILFAIKACLESKTDSFLVMVDGSNVYYKRIASSDDLNELSSLTLVLMPKKMVKVASVQEWCEIVSSMYHR